MSIASYRLNVRRGVTGFGTPTDTPAAFEQASPRHSLPASLYKLWGRIARSAAFADKREINAERRDLLDAVAWHLGQFSCKDIETDIITDGEILRDALDWYWDNDWRVVAGIQLEDGETLSVGLLPAWRRDRVKLVSTYIPDGLKRVMSIEQLSHYLAEPESGGLNRYNRYVEANFMALPPNHVVEEAETA